MTGTKTYLEQVADMYFPQYGGSSHAHQYTHTLYIASNPYHLNQGTEGGITASHDTVTEDLQKMITSQSSSESHETQALTCINASEFNSTGGSVGQQSRCKGIGLLAPENTDVLSSDAISASLSTQLNVPSQLHLRKLSLSRSMSQPDALTPPDISTPSQCSLCRKRGRVCTFTPAEPIGHSWKQFKGRRRTRCDPCRRGKRRCDLKDVLERRV